MADGTTVLCPHCGTFSRASMVLEDVHLRGAVRENLWITCPRCGQGFDAAPADGIYSTVGDLLVMAQRSPAVTRELEELRAGIEQLEQQQQRALSREDVEAIIAARAPQAAPLLFRITRDASLTNAIAFGALVVAILTLVLSGR